MNIHHGDKRRPVWTLIAGAVMTLLAVGVAAASAGYAVFSNFGMKILVAGSGKGDQVLQGRRPQLGFRFVMASARTPGGEVLCRWKEGP
jgi:hypothetical protein